MLPVIVPLILALYVCFNAINSSDNELFAFCSYFPLTSPIVMLVRIYHGVSIYSIGISMFILVLTVFVLMHLSAKVYNAAILLYGKKISYKDILLFILKKGDSAR